MDFVILMSNQYRLAQGIIALSEANNWDEAKEEWYLENISFHWDTCLCGHHPIRERCHLRNKINHRTTIVGNCCVNKFLGISSNKFFAAVKKVMKDNTKSFNKEIYVMAYEQGIINDWERGFILNIYRKRVLSEKQLFHKVQINKKILAWYK